MSLGILEEINLEVASLPLEKQIETLDFIKFIAQQKKTVTTAQSPRTVKSVRGVLKRNLSNLENDLSEVREEMWQNFPREVPR